jgi:DNA polymerase I
MELSQFGEIWLYDFEFSAPPGERSTPICLVARELHSGHNLRVWQDKLLALKSPPFSIGKGSLSVGFYASAEMGCHLSLGWQMPTNLLDLYAEFRNLTNNLPLICGNNLLGALAYFGLSSIEAAEKKSMQQLAQRGGPWTPEEKIALLDYCQSDVDALVRLFERMAT